MTRDPREVALELIDFERARQENLKREGRFTHTAADPEPALGEKLAMLGEEFGEVACETLTQPGEALAHDSEGSREGLRKELIQVAAICVAWIESLIEEENGAAGD